MTELHNDDQKPIIETPSGVHPVVVANEDDDYVIEFCYKHPQTEAMLHCYECNNAICPKCAQRTPVGYICPDCKKGRKQRFIKSKPHDVILAGITALVLGAIASVVTLVGSWWFIMFLSPLAGVLIADIVWRVVGRRWGPNLWWVTVGGIVVGALPVFAIHGLGMLFAVGSGGMNWWSIQNVIIVIIHIVAASGAAIARLKLT